MPKEGWIVRIFERKGIAKDEYDGEVRTLKAAMENPDLSLKE